MVVQYLFALIQKQLVMIQRTISLAIANWPITLIALVMGLSVEEFWYGFRFLKFFGII